MSSFSKNGRNQSIEYWDLNEKEDKEAFCLAHLLLTEGLKLPILKAVIDLGVLEMIKKCGPGGRLSAAEIAAMLTTSNTEAATMLGRLLDFLVVHSILNVAPVTLPSGAVERRYGLAPVCKFLTQNEDGVSLVSFSSKEIFKPIVFSSLGLKDVVLEGGQPFMKAFGTTLYEYDAQNPEHQKAFHKAMSDNSTLVMHKLVMTYKGFQGISSLVDVGGGNGTSLAMILSHYPNIKGINFDRPHVVANAPSYPGVDHVGGDMFDEIPKGDAIFLKWILHCFNDETCVRILKKCYDALPKDKDGKVIICEHLLPDANEISGNVVSNSVVHLDMIMMVVPGGKERTQTQFQDLAFAAGFHHFQVVCSAYNANIMEFIKNN